MIMRTFSGLRAMFLLRPEYKTQQKGQSGDPPDPECLVFSVPVHDPSLPFFFY
jgi:hypothetical protein